MSEDEIAQLEAFEKFRILKMTALDNPTPVNERAAKMAMVEFEKLYCKPTNVIPFRRFA